MSGFDPTPASAPEPGAAAEQAAWRRYAITVAALVIGTLATIIVLGVMIGPYGPLPVSLPMSRPPMVQSQRLAFPAIVRSGAFDAFVIGSSTGRPIDPAAIDAHFGARTANVAVNGATQHEQRLMAGLIVRQVPNLRLLVWTLDSTWCAPSVEAVGHPQQPAAGWLYDDVWWNDLPHLVSTRALEAAAALVRYHAGVAAPRYPVNGFLIETPPEDTFDRDKARARILAGGRRATKDPMGPGMAPNGKEDAEYRFPALAWIEEVLAAMPPATSRRMLVLMPMHAAVLPERGSTAEARARACKRALVEVGRRREAIVLDFQFASALTLADDTYWDAVHFRRQPAAQITRTIVTVALGGTADGWSRLLYRPSPLAGLP